MKRLAALLVCITLLVTLPLGPWQHVHDHGHDAHHAGGALHAHQSARPSGATWRTHGPDEDARTLSAVAASVATGVTYLAALVATPFSLDTPLMTCADFEPIAESGHDPPVQRPVASRGPPSLPASWLA